MHQSLPRRIPTEPQGPLESTLGFEQRRQRDYDEWMQDVSDHFKAQRLTKAYETGRQECQALCSAIHAAFPREIRDMVYDRLITPGIRHHVLRSHDRDGFPIVSTNPLVHISFFDPRSRIPEQVTARRDIWKYSEYTGGVVAKEIAERWYHTGLFIFDVEDWNLDQFLSTDVWERANVPADAVRHLQLNVGRHRMQNTTMRRYAIEDFKHLLRLGNKRTDIVFYLSQVCEFKHLCTLLEIIAPIVYRLREESYTRAKIYQGDTELCQMDITHIFDETPETLSELIVCTSLHFYDKKINTRQRSYRSNESARLIQILRQEVMGLET